MVAFTGLACRVKPKLLTAEVLLPLECRIVCWTLVKSNVSCALSVYVLGENKGRANVVPLGGTCHNAMQMYLSHHLMLLAFSVV